MKLQFAGIRRKTDFSPNQITNDGLIILKTAQELTKLGVDCKLYEETDVFTDSINEKVIFTMTRGEEALKKLVELEEKGKFLINSPVSSLNCYRIQMSAKLKKAGIPFPESKVVSTASDKQYKISEIGERKIWVKRGDVHAVHREDVSLVYGDEELNFLLKEFANRGIKDAILQKHIYGDVIKFYSVRDTDFFRWYYVNGNNHYKFDQSRLKKLSENSAEVLNLYIYGGDAIVGEDGTITIIDVNDWPSFANFRDEASKYIAKIIYSNAVKSVEAMSSSLENVI